MDYYKHFYAFKQLAKQMKSRPCLHFVSFIDQLQYLFSKIYLGFVFRIAFSSNFVGSHVKLVREVSGNKHLVMTRPDKGNGVVIFDKEAYIGSMEGIVSDTDKFSLVN